MENVHVVLYEVRFQEIYIVFIVRLVFLYNRPVYSRRVIAVAMGMQSKDQYFKFGYTRVHG